MDLQFIFYGAIILIVIVFQIWGAISRSETGINPLTKAFEITKDTFSDEETYKWVISETYHGTSVKIHLIVNQNWIQDILLIAQGNHYGSWHKKGHLGISLLLGDGEKVKFNEGKTDYNGSKNKIIVSWISILEESKQHLLSKGISKICIHNTQGDVIIESNVENSKKVINSLSETILQNSFKVKKYLASNDLNSEKSITINSDINNRNLNDEINQNKINPIESNITNVDKQLKDSKKSKIKESKHLSVAEIIEDLNKLTGLSDVKKEVQSLVNYINFQKQREAKGLKNTEINYHCVFTGSPGTGKTTVARIISKLYYQLGIIDKGHLIEVDRAGLIGEYVGQTAAKVDNVVKSAIGGVLFIDEAYSLASNTESDYGKEAISTLLKRMEDHRDNLVVIVAGYTSEMKDFIELNPGLKSRFNRYIHFKDYTAPEMLDIFKRLCKDSDYILSKEAESNILNKLEKAHLQADKSFGNARFVRNLFEKIIENLSNRIILEKNLSQEMLSVITLVDTEV